MLKASVSLRLLGACPLLLRVALKALNEISSPRWSLHPGRPEEVNRNSLHVNILHFPLSETRAPQPALARGKGQRTRRICSRSLFSCKCQLCPSP